MIADIPTPRTDAAARLVRSTENGVLVHADLARALERELYESRNAERLARVQLGNEREKVRLLRDALTRLRDCDWVIPLHEVQDIARDALAKAEESK